MKNLLKYIFKKKNLATRERISELKYQLWQREKIILERKQNIKSEKYQIKENGRRKRQAFNKLAFIFLFINFTILEIFTGWVTVSSFSLAYETGINPDLTPLITLLGLVIGETVSYGIYCAKSKAENTQGGIIYETAMKTIDEDNSDDAVG